MTAAEFLEQSLKAIDWNAYAAAFLQKKPIIARVSELNLSIALWSKELVEADRDNPALSFVHEMQQSGFYIPVMLSLALYKPAASAIRGVIEAALYYGYFRNHPVELATLARSKGFYITKSDILDFHKEHTPSFFQNASLFGQPGKLNECYSKVSAIIHGQLPGKWGQLTGLNQIKPYPTLEEDVCKTFEEAILSVNDLLFLTVGTVLWGRFSTDGKKRLLKGMPGQRRTALGLDRA